MQFNEMLVFQGVEKKIADGLCNDVQNDVWVYKHLPASKHVTQIMAKDSGTIKLIDASIIARLVNIHRYRNFQLYYP